MNTRATVTINTKDDRAQVARWAQNVASGTVVTFRKKSRSTEQNAKLHAMLGEVADQVEWYGQKLAIEDWKDVFTASLRHARVVPGIDKGTFVPLGMHTSTLTIEEMSNLIELIYAFGADPDHPVIFKEPQQNTNPADDAAPSSSAATADDAPTSSSTLSEADWLVVVARMLWSVTPKEPTETSFDTLNNQRISAGYQMPEGTSAETREKAGSIYFKCKEAIEDPQKRGDILRYIANRAGCDVSELEA